MRLPTGWTRCVRSTRAEMDTSSLRRPLAGRVLRLELTTGSTTPLDLIRECTSLREAQTTLTCSGGSIIDPASVQGVYGLRPSWSAISLEGAIPLQATQDTAGFFAREAQAGLEFAQGWYGDRFGNYSALPTVSQCR